MDLMEQLSGGEKIVIDGGVGSEIQRRGLPMHPQAWCATSHIDAPEIVKSVHLDYIHAGAKIVTANTFHGARHILDCCGLGGDVAAINSQAVKIAKQAVYESEASGLFVAGSMSTIPLLGKPADVSRGEQCYRNFCEQADVLAEAEVDFILCEMLMDSESAEALIDAAHKTGLPVWAGVSASLDPDNVDNLMAFRTPHKYGAMVREPFSQLVKTVSSLQVDVIGAMHTALKILPTALSIIRNHWQGYAMAYPQIGEFDDAGWCFDLQADPVDYARHMVGLAEAHNVQVIGGCCGTSTEHIAALAAAV